MGRGGAQSSLSARSVPSSAEYGGEDLLQCGYRQPAARLISTKEFSRGRRFFKCRQSLLFCGAPEILKQPPRDAKVDHEWRIHQLEHKIETANHDLNEAREMIVDLEASVSLSSALVKKRDRSIMWMRTVIVVLVMAWYFIS